MKPILTIGITSYKRVNELIRCIKSVNTRYIDDIEILVSEDNSMSGGMAFLLTLITCGIYGYYWAYKMGKLVYDAKVKRGLPASDNAVLYLILQIFGLGIVNYCIIQSDLNAIAQSAN